MWKEAKIELTRVTFTWTSGLMGYDAASKADDNDLTIMSFSTIFQFYQEGGNEKIYTIEPHYEKVYVQQESYPNPLGQQASP